MGREYAGSANCGAAVNKKNQAANNIKLIALFFLDFQPRV